MNEQTMSAENNNTQSGKQTKVMCGTECTTKSGKSVKAINIKDGIFSSDSYICTETINELRCTLLAKKNSEALARGIVAAFCLPANPTIEVLEDIKTAVSEAVTNCIVHAYEGNGGKIDIALRLYADRVEMDIRDYGVGITDIAKALTPFYTTKSIDERSGMGFTIMESFMSSLSVMSDNGLEVKMVKNFKKV